MKKIIVANWKMNGSLPFLEEFMPFLAASLSLSPYEIIICPPFPYLTNVATCIKNTPATLGAQNCHALSHGAFTGEVSAPMLAELGCQAVITGHSERRSSEAETDSLVQAKAAAIQAAGMTAIICVGETLQHRQSAQAIDHVSRQLQACLPAGATGGNTRIAYEPLWAIGTGQTASSDDIACMHQALSLTLKTPVPVLYGGSVTDQNAKAILALPYVDGILVGGASLKRDVFQKMISA